MRECIKIARLAGNNIAKTQRVINMLATHCNRRVKLGISYELDIAFL